MGGLTNRRVALLGTRKIEEQTTIIQHLGGTTVHRPAQGTIYFDAQFIGDEIKKIIDGQFQWIIFTTSIGVEKLFQIAEEMWIERELLLALKKMNIVARGYKTINALKKRELKAIVRDDDGSIEGLIRSLKPYHLKNQHIAVQLYGEPSPLLIDWLSEQQTTIQEILPYQHIPPKPETLTQLLEEVLTKKVDAISFTSTSQVRYLFNFAEEVNQKDVLLNALETKTLALAVGKVTGKALQDVGVNRMLIPHDERIGSALMTLSQYYKQQRPYIVS
ncbi:uroporphyrinogen-III synthase [Ureibacillus composti]|nr:uroporphyrinogen-III synthase [Ureibacillus composti]